MRRSIIISCAVCLIVSTVVYWSNGEFTVWNMTITVTASILGGAINYKEV